MEARKKKQEENLEVHLLLTKGASCSSSQGPAQCTRKDSPSVTTLVDLQLNPAFRLACGCTLLLAGSIADRIGSRAINILGTIIIGMFILASGLARTGIQLIIFRAIQGTGEAMYLPTAISIIAENFPEGKQRSLGFGWLGVGQPLGFQIGLVLGGIFEEFSLSWRFAFYLCAGLTVFIAGTSYCFLPPESVIQRPAATWRALGTDIDWVGVALSTSCLGILSYIFTYVVGLISIPRCYNLTQLTDGAYYIES